MDDRTRKQLSSLNEVKHEQKIEANTGRSATPGGDTSRNLADQRIQEGMAQGAFDNLEGSGKPVEQRRPMTDRRAADLVEQRIQDAIDQGMFDNLEGAGKPIDLFDDAHIPPDMRMAFRLMKGQQLTPPWIELQKDYRQGQEQYRTWFNSAKSRWSRMRPDERDRAAAELRSRLNDLNVIIHSLNAAVPIDTMRVGLLIYEREFRALQGIAS